jgi:glycosyltransferase involved in cell wall biosynthesis
MNAFSRKHILEVCESFTIAYSINKNIQLIATIQKTNLLEINTKNKIETYMKHPAIKIIQEHLSYFDILDLYYQSHVVIHVSKHEGLGLGFYESIATGTPVITLDTPPHNEIILNNINGWTIPCYYKKMTDNDDAFYGSAFFDPIDLANKIISIINNDNDLIKKVLDSLQTDWENRLNPILFENRFISQFY